MPDPTVMTKEEFDDTSKHEFAEALVDAQKKLDQVIALVKIKDQEIEQLQREKRTIEYNAFEEGWVHGFQSARELFFKNEERTPVHARGMSS